METLNMTEPVDNISNDDFSIDISPEENMIETHTPEDFSTNVFDYIDAEEDIEEKIEKQVLVSKEKVDTSEFLLWPDEPTRFTTDDIDSLLEWCFNQDASDITIQTDKYIMAEIHGTIRPVTASRMDAADINLFLNLLYGSNAMARLAGGNDLDLSYEVNTSRDNRIRFRVNVTAILTMGRDGVQITMRSLPNDPPTMEDLNIEQELKDHWYPKQGLVLITGPTGSGKTTLLASGNRMLIESGKGKILTYEAPIEFVYDNINNAHSLISQTEIPRHLPSFAAGVRNALRRKPEVILVGEARDKETINAAIEAGQTGHTVYSTVHTIGVSATIRRMTSVYGGEERDERAYSLMETLRMIVTQTLLKTVDGKRVAIREWLVFNQDIREALLGMENRLWPNEVQKYVESHGRTMAESANLVYKQGIIDKETYLSVVKGTKYEEELEKGNS
ncbi:MAG: ATPase, T2SS/T4P/T4SS family [Alphaproteobacteria bacterium]|jgi:defect-in-organelle-trafficking protein DotB|nr:ATPase, T2SS/T4P/T4SS family [Alphaproteobacteria bacterium]